MTFSSCISDLVTSPSAAWPPRAPSPSPGPSCSFLGAIAVFCLIILAALDAEPVAADDFGPFSDLTIRLCVLTLYMA